MALRDLEGIVDFILANDDPLKAARIYERIHDSVSRLAELPARGRIVPELRDEGLEMYRELLISKVWRVIYRVRGTRVVILSVLDGRRDLEELLLQRALDPTEDD